jgi:sec-independent protein translocase protein TatA
MFGLGTSEILIVGVVALLLFGHRLPQAMRGLGHGFKELRDGIHGIESDLEEAAQ